jgi:hypothetical protein
LGSWIENLEQEAGTSNSSFVKLLFESTQRNNVVASTSAVALCASENGLLNKTVQFTWQFKSSSDVQAIARVWHPVQVSKTGMDAMGESTPLRCNSAPIILTSKPDFA